MMIGNSYHLEASDVVQVVVGRNGMETLTNEAGEVTRSNKIFPPLDELCRLSLFIVSVM